MFFSLPKKLKFSWKQKFYDSLKKSFYWVLTIFVMSTMILIFSIIIYLIVYYLVVIPPVKEHIKHDLDLKYPISKSANLISKPSDTFWPTSYLFDSNIYSLECVKPMTYPHLYDWILYLKLPEAPVNFEAGVFMVKIILFPEMDKINSLFPATLKTQLHNSIQSFLKLKMNNLTNVQKKHLENISFVSEKHMMLQWKSNSYRTFQSFLYSFPNFFFQFLGFDQLFEETQSLQTLLISKAFSSKEKLNHQCFLLSINNPNLIIYKASLEINVVLEGWKFYSYYWFWTSFFIGSTIIYIIVIFIILTLTIIILLRSD